MERSPPASCPQCGHETDFPPPEDVFSLPDEVLQDVASKPLIHEVVSAEHKDGLIKVHLKVRGKDEYLLAEVTDSRTRLKRVFSPDLVDVILGEKEIPEGTRAQTFSKIASQYKKQVVDMAVPVTETSTTPKRGPQDIKVRLGRVARSN